MGLYYIGLNANNAIGNDGTFSGSITIYPTKEKGNIFYSSTFIDDTSSKSFFEKYKTFVYDKCKQILSQDKDAEFMCFNKKVKDLVVDFDNIKFIRDNDIKLVDFLNDKFAVRDRMSKVVPILDYDFINDEQLNYDKLINDFGKCFVLQQKNGAGGNTTYYVDSKEYLESIRGSADIYSVSRYIKNTPVNATVVIGNEEIVYLPISSQLIEITEGKFKYVGGDFVDPLGFTDKEKSCLVDFINKIVQNIKEKGYRGVLGIDLVLDTNGNVYFMEINPRFQSSTFIISKYLRDISNVDIAKLHYEALNGISFSEIHIPIMDCSFLNCNNKNNFDNISNFTCLKNGYFEENSSSVYRKIYNRSIITEGNFERRY